MFNRLHIHAENTAPLVHNTEDTTLQVPDPAHAEEEEVLRVQGFVSQGCSCTLYNGGQCSARFNLDQYLEFRGQCQELTRQELDMAVLGQIAASTFTSETPVRSPTQNR